MGGVVPGWVCWLSDVVKSTLDQEIISLPRDAVSDDETRYPVDEPSMRAFLETFFTRHLFQLQRSLAEYIASPDLQKTLRFGPLRLLDIGSGPALASLAILDLIHRMMLSANPRTRIWPFRMVHVLNDTSSVCLATGKRMLTAYHRLARTDGLTLHNDRILTMSAAFPRNMQQVQRLASFLGGYDIIILSYVVSPLIDDCGLQDLVAAVELLGRLCSGHGRVLIVQDRFQESIVQRLAHMLNAECQEQTITQEIYPPRGENERYTYTYYDCLHMPWGNRLLRRGLPSAVHQMRQLHLAGSA